MSLSDQSKPAAKPPESWQKYEIKPFGAGWNAPGTDSGEFFVLQAENSIDSDFIPLELNRTSKERFRTQNDELAAVQPKTDLIEQEAYENGFSQGEKAGFEIGEKKAVKIIGNMETLLIEMTDMKKNLLKRHEKDIMACIFAIAETIVKNRSSVEGQVIRDAVFSALDLAVDHSEIKIKVNPMDYDYIETLRPEFFSSFRSLKSMMVTADASVTRGGCVMETPKGDIDATIEGRLDKVRHCLMAAMSEKSDE